MTEIGRISLSSNNLLQKMKNLTLNTSLNETNLLEKVELDTVNLSRAQGSEKFDDVREELRQNVPDSTSTVEEKELAISYIDRMLNCSDISSDMKIYWQNKKDIITQEIQNIKNTEKVGSGEKVEDVWKEFEEFTNEFWGKQLDSSLSPQDYNEYYFAYYNAYISFCDRFLACTDLTPELQEEYQNMQMYAMRDLNYHYRDLNRYNNQEGNVSESFDSVFVQMRQNVPDSTSTVAEKELAISYIDRMLSCPDIPNPEYWENKKSVIEMEIQDIENTEILENPTNKEKVSDVWKEFEAFIDKYKDSMQTDKLERGDTYEYSITYNRLCMSFYKRLLKCSDATPRLRAEYVQYLDEHAKIMNDLSVKYDNYLFDLENKQNPFKH